MKFSLSVFEILFSITFQANLPNFFIYKLIININYKLNIFKLSTYIQVVLLKTFEEQLK